MSIKKEYLRHHSKFLSENVGCFGEGKREEKRED